MNCTRCMQKLVEHKKQPNKISQKINKWFCEVVEDVLDNRDTPDSLYDQYVKLYDILDISHVRPDCVTRRRHASMNYWIKLAYPKKLNTVF